MMKKFLLPVCLLVVCAITVGSLIASNPSAVGFTITGIVVDETGDPITGVNVVEKTTTNGTVTDLDGYFVITVSRLNCILQFSYIGHLPQEINLSHTSSTHLRIVLKSDH